MAGRLAVDEVTIRRTLKRLGLSRKPVERAAMLPGIEAEDSAAVEAIQRTAGDHRPQSSPHRTAALSALCAQLDALAIPFPGTQLRLRLAVQAPEPVI